MGRGPARFVDAVRGHDANPGTQRSPWRTIRRALGELRAGDTLYLRGGVYHEHLYVSLRGRADKPITIRGFPGERAILDGGFREFLESPRDAWVPVPGVPDYFRSKRPYRNERYILGWFADSMVPLLTYQHRIDIEERSRVYFEKQDGEPYPLPIYLGPGIWYDADSGHIHARLTNTNYGSDFDYPGTADYRGVRDPREVGLVIAPFRSLPIFLDGAEHVTIQDIAVRGAGENALLLHGSQYVTFDNVVTYCGTYGLRARSSGPVKFLRSTLYGGNPPWFVHAAGCLRNIPGPRTLDDPESGRNKLQRDVTRLNTHVLVAIQGRTEEQVDYAFPGNHHWEFAYSDFTDGFDGIHLGGECIRFHHNRVDRFFDDSIYLTPLTSHYLDQVHVYQNLFTRCLLPIGFGGLARPGGPIYIYRNVIDQRTELPSTHGKWFTNQPFVGHFRSVADFNFGPLHIYQNTLLSKMNPRLSDTVSQDVLRSYGLATLAFTRADGPRRVFNNLFAYTRGMIPPDERTLPLLDEDVQVDGNFHHDLRDPVASAKKLARYRKSAFFRKTRQRYKPGWEARARVGDARFLACEVDPWTVNDYRLGAGSEAIGAGIVLPAGLPDPLRPARGGRPDAGALPFGSRPFRPGRNAGNGVLSWLEKTR